MEYMMKVIISDPNTEEGKTSAIPLNLKANFVYNPDTYGNGYYMKITDESGEGLQNLYDIRYDTSFHKDDAKEYLKTWARSYWNGENGAYKIDSINIEEL